MVDINSKQTHRQKNDRKNKLLSLAFALGRLSLLHLPFLDMASTNGVKLLFVFFLGELKFRVFILKVQTHGLKIRLCCLAYFTNHRDLCPLRLPRSGSTSSAPSSTSLFFGFFVFRRDLLCCMLLRLALPTHYYSLLLQVVTFLASDDGGGVGGLIGGELGQRSFL